MEGVSGGWREGGKEGGRGEKDRERQIETERMYQRPCRR